MILTIDKVLPFEKKIALKIEFLPLCYYITNVRAMFKENDNMEKKRLYFDMDGVLVNFQSGIDKLSDETKKEYAGRLDEVPGIFALMEPMPGAIDAVHKLKEHYDVYILSTAPWENPSAWSDKLQWIKKYLGDVFYKRMVITHCKHLLNSGNGEFLIDDRDKHGAAEFGERHIMFGSERFPNWDSVVEYLIPKA